MAKTYGPVVSFRQGKRRVCIVNSYKVCSLATQGVSKLSGNMNTGCSGNYAEAWAGAGRSARIHRSGRDQVWRDAYAARQCRRPSPPTTQVLPLRAWQLTYPDKIRRALHSQLQPSTAGQHKPIQFRAALDVVLDVLHAPAEHIDHARRFAASLIMTMTYGKTTPTHYGDPEVEEINVHNTRLGKVVPAGLHIVDNYPMLRHVPFVVATLKRWHEEELAFFSKMVDDVRVQVVCGDMQAEQNPVR